MCKTPNGKVIVKVLIGRAVESSNHVIVCGNAEIFIKRKRGKPRKPRDRVPPDKEYKLGLPERRGKLYNLQWLWVPRSEWCILVHRCVKNLQV